MNVMLVMMKSGYTDRDAKRVIDKVESAGGLAQWRKLQGQNFLVLTGCPNSLNRELKRLPGVESVRVPTGGHWLVTRQCRPQDTVIEVKGAKIGGANPPIIMAGPCAVESRDQLLRIAEKVADAGASLMRGGAFKPRSSPYSFQGMQEEGLALLAEARERFGIAVVSELRDVNTLDLFLDYEIDVIQVGARNMQNFEILRCVGRAGRPVLLKRGPANTIEEWLNAAEYILLEGNSQVMLCERGIVAPRGAETRYLFDIAAIPIVREHSHLPVIADPSHAAGDRRWVPAMAQSAVAAGANGLLVEVHDAAEEALCDGPQSLSPESLEQLLADLKRRGYLDSPVEHHVSSILTLVGNNC